VGGDSPFDFDGLHYVSDKEESKASRQRGTHIIISASGMCEAGRILHHLREGIEDSRNTILIVGYQAQSTLGRRIVERQREVKVFGVMRRLAAEVVVLNGFPRTPTRRNSSSSPRACAARASSARCCWSTASPGPGCVDRQADRARIRQGARARPDEKIRV